MDWWSKKPRRINVVVDNDSWVIPYAKELVVSLNGAGDKAILVRDYAKVKAAEVSFYLGCVKITPSETLAKSKVNLVAHASDLPKGRGFSPLTYMIVDGKNRIPLCLLEMADDVDAGPIIYKEYIEYKGHELVDELRRKLGEEQVRLCMKYLSQEKQLKGVPQKGKPSYYKRRKPEDSKLEIDQSIARQFDLFRVADNEKYPVFFEKDGHTYILKIEKKPLGGSSSQRGRGRSGSPGGA
jgi:methionyl-tRNA formyltransferase